MSKKQQKLFGPLLPLVEDEDDIAYVVCAKALDDSGQTFKDNQFGRCSKCGDFIKFRPDVPPKPPKVCIPCFMQIAASEDSH